MFALEMLRLQFMLEAIDPIHLPHFKGSAFHGGFGHALEAISPIWFEYFFQAQNKPGNSIPKPFVLTPPLDNHQNYQPGEIFQCQLTLFGEATRHYSIAQAAIEYLGRVLGLGHNRGKYKIISITDSSFSADRLTPNSLTLKLITRLRLKADNHLQKQGPDFSLLIKRLLGRLKTLQLNYSDSPIDHQQYQQLMELSAEIQIQNVAVHWDDWNRYSGRQKEWMKFGGLLGEIQYQGNLQAFIPILQLGEWCHVGGKSSFGLGKYRLNDQEASA